MLYRHTQRLQTFSWGMLKKASELLPPAPAAVLNKQMVLCNIHNVPRPWPRPQHWSVYIYHKYWFMLITHAQFPVFRFNSDCSMQVARFVLSLWLRVCKKTLIGETPSCCSVEEYITAVSTWSESHITFSLSHRKSEKESELVLHLRPLLNPWDRPTFSKWVCELLFLQCKTCFFTRFPQSWQMFHKIWLRFNSQNGMS